MAERTTTTQIKPRQLSPVVLAGFEKIGLASEIPIAKLPEIFRLRGVVRELIGHIRALEEKATA